MAFIMNYDCKALANLLFPDITETVEDLEKKYPERDLKEGARVTRFAPSPTGYLHIGGLFGALVDVLTARATNGVSYLRIEDTDKKREIDDGVSAIINGFNSFGIGFVTPVRRALLKPPAICSCGVDVNFARRTMSSPNLSRRESTVSSKRNFFSYCTGDSPEKRSYC